MKLKYDEPLSNFVGVLSTRPYATEKFNESLSFDKRMAQEDIQGSKGYARALAKTTIITDEEATALVDGLDVVAKEWAAGTFAIKVGLCSRLNQGALYVFAPISAQLKLCRSSKLTLNHSKGA